MVQSFFLRRKLCVYKKVLLICLGHMLFIQHKPSARWYKRYCKIPESPFIKMCVEAEKGAVTECSDFPPIAYELCEYLQWVRRTGLWNLAGYQDLDCKGEHSRKLRGFDQALVRHLPHHLDVLAIIWALMTLVSIALHWFLFPRSTFGAYIFILHQNSERPSR